MKEIEIVAKTKGQPDLKGKAPVAEAWADCVKIAGGEKEAIAIFNTQIKTNAMNKLRKPAGSISLGKLIASAKASGKLTKDAQDKLADILKKAGVVIPDGVL